MNEHVKELAGIVVAAVLAVDGFLHAYWATGQIWPAQDQLVLIQVVLNSNKTRLLRPTVLAPLAGLLFLAALIVLARVHHLGLLGQLIPGPLLQVAILAVAAGLLLRAVAGVGWVLGLAASQSKLFYRLNLLVYTPVCLVLFVAAVAAAFS